VRRAGRNGQLCCSRETRPKGNGVSKVHAPRRRPGETLAEAIGKRLFVSPTDEPARRKRSSQRYSQASRPDRSLTRPQTSLLRPFRPIDQRCSPQSAKRAAEPSDTADAKSAARPARFEMLAEVYV
jgi:hypothetical protein